MAPELRSQLGTYLRSQLGTYFMEQGYEPVFHSAPHMRLCEVNTFVHQGLGKMRRGQEGRKAEVRFLWACLISRKCYHPLTVGTTCHLFALFDISASSYNTNSFSWAALSLL